MNSAEQTQQTAARPIKGFNSDMVSEERQVCVLLPALLPSTTQKHLNCEDVMEHDTQRTTGSGNVQ